jgi:hypothetical protein
MLGPENFSKASLSSDESVLTAPLYLGILSRVKPRLNQPFVMKVRGGC